MSETLETWIDAGVGETREALVRDGRAIALRVLRVSEDGAKARWGELYAARVTEVDRRRRGAFLDLGLRGGQGFLPLDGEGRARLGADPFPVTQGMSVTAAVAREAARGKSPVLQLVKIGPEGAAPRRLAQHDCDLDLVQAKPADAETRFKLDEAFDQALARKAPIPGGGTLTIEPTSALVAIDVDAGARGGFGDPERFALDLNIAAAKEAARQLSLRALGGIVAIDFVSMRAKSHRVLLEQGVRDAFVGDRWSVQVGTLSRFGVFELSRAQLRTPLHEVMLDADGRLSAESLALDALRAVEREMRAHAGREVACAVAPEVKAWLDGAMFDWRAQLSERIGVRWTVQAAPMAREQIDVRAL